LSFTLSRRTKTDCVAKQLFSHPKGNSYRGEIIRTKDKEHSETEARDIEEATRTKNNKTTAEDNKSIRTTTGLTEKRNRSSITQKHTETHRK
jgi:hypothetical protein